MQLFEGMGLPSEVVFWPSESPFRISLPTRLLVPALASLVKLGFTQLTIDIYPGSNLAAVYAEMSRDMIPP